MKPSSEVRPAMPGGAPVQAPDYGEPCASGTVLDAAWGDGQRLASNLRSDRLLHRNTCSQPAQPAVTTFHDVRLGTDAPFSNDRSPLHSSRSSWGHPGNEDNPGTRRPRQWSPVRSSFSSPELDENAEPKGPDLPQLHFSSQEFGNDPGMTGRSRPSLAWSRPTLEMRVEQFPETSELSTAIRSPVNSKGTEPWLVVMPHGDHGGSLLRRSLPGEGSGTEESPSQPGALGSIGSMRDSHPEVLESVVGDLCAIRAALASSQEGRCRPGRHGGS